MTVPLTLLGLLERGPSHGYDLKRDYDAFFGRGRPLRYSQVYATLSRLARDGKAVAGPAEKEAGPERRRYVITEAGIADVEVWLAEDHALYRLEADLRWIDHTAARLDLLARAVHE